MNESQAVQFAQWSGLPLSMVGALRSWEAVPVLDDDGRQSGMGAVDGTEVHLALAPQHRGVGHLTRRRCRTWLAPLLERRGFLTTRAHAPTPEREAFLRRLGFERTRVDGEIHHYMLAALPFEREN